MKKFLLIIAALAVVTLANAQTNIPPTGLQLTPEQIQKLNGGIDALVPLIPAQYTPAAIKVIGWLGTLALLGRVIVGWKNGGLFGVFAGLFGGTNTPKTPGNPANPASAINGRGGASGLMRLALCLALPCLFLTGCGSIPHQLIDNESGSGLKAKIPVGYSGNNIFELDLTVGTFKHTGVIQPVLTNRVYTPSLVVAAATRGTFEGGAMLGSTGTNIASNPLATVKGGDSYVVTTGHTAAGVTNNAEVSAQAWQDASPANAK